MRRDEVTRSDVAATDPATGRGAAPPPPRRDRHRARVAGLATAAALGLLAASCGQTDNPGQQSTGPATTVSRYVNETTSDETPTTGGQLVYGIPAETSSFNPAIGSWASYSLTIARSFFDTLTTYDSTGEIQPLLAEKLEHSDDYRTWTVTLRDGITYSNGKPLTAESFVEAQKKFKESPILSETYARVDGFEVKDKLTYTVQANQAWTSFPHAMSTQIGVAVDPAWLASSDITHPIGVGAFTVDRWDVNKEMVLKKNPSYWRKDSRGNAYPYLDGITYRIIVDEAARADALRKGEIDIMMQTYSTPSVGEMLSEAKSGKFQAFSDKSETPEDYVVVNTLKPPLDDVDARRALAFAIDQNDYIAKITGGLDEPANSPWAPSSKWYTDTNYPKYDLNEAKKLVEAVKAKNGGKFTVTLLGNPSNESVRVQQYLQEKWKAAGIEVNLQADLQQTKIIKMIQGNYELALTQQFDNVHPYNEMIYWQDWKKPLGTLSLNFARITDPQVTQLAIEAAGSTGDTEKQKYNAIAKRFGEIVPFVWLAHASRTLIAKPRVVNVLRATLPDGKRTIEFIQGSHSVYQIWLKR